VTGEIYLNGQIGSGYDEQGNFLKGVELVDVITSVRAMGDVDSINVHINSPGGFVEVGDMIYSYLESLKKDKKITTIAEKLVGSIATKIFLVGDERLIGDGDEFFIHNPSVNPGQSDANKLIAYAEHVSETESNLRKFYAEKTDNTEEALKPLMDVETSLDADQAIKLGFATGKKTQKVFAKVKSNMNLIDDVLKKAKGLFQPKAAMSLPLKDGQTVVTVEAEEGEDLIGKPAKVGDAPAPDGSHELADGKILIVEGGLVKEIKEAPAADDVEDKKYKEMQANFDKLAQAVNALIEAQTKSKDSLVNLMDEKITALKSTIKTSHTPEKKKVEAHKPSVKYSLDEIMAAKRAGKIEEFKSMYKEKYGVEPED
jgi:ATP-dependent protease ClpP protease subunit